jgi:hypothetical protein
MYSILTLLLVWCFSLNGNNRQSQVIDLCQYAVQSRLISHFSLKDSLTVLSGNGEATEPVRPGRINAALDKDKVSGWLIVIAPVGHLNAPSSLDVFLPIIWID